MFALHKMNGTGRPLSLGGFVVHGIVFSDDGFGNFLKVDHNHYLIFMESGFSWH